MTKIKAIREKRVARGGPDWEQQNRQNVEKEFEDMNANITNIRLQFPRGGGKNGDEKNPLTPEAISPDKPPGWEDPTK